MCAMHVAHQVSHVLLVGQDFKFQIVNCQLKSCKTFLASRLEEEEPPFSLRRSHPLEGQGYMHRDLYNLCRGRRLVRSNSCKQQQQQQQL